jgi:hypothetical protein
MRVSQEMGIPRIRSLYSMRAPTRISIGRGVTISKRRDGGVMASRLPASAKKGKTSPGDPGRRCSRERV